MSPMLHRCPLCNSMVNMGAITVSLDANVISVEGQQIKVSPTEAEYAYVLWQKYPGYADAAHIIDSVYGALNDHVPGSNIVSVHMSKLRNRLKDTRWGIISNQNGAYKLCKEGHEQAQ